MIDDDVLDALGLDNDFLSPQDYVTVRAAACNMCTLEYPGAAHPQVIASDVSITKVISTFRLQTMPVVACSMGLASLLPAPATEGECSCLALQVYARYMVEGTTLTVFCYRRSYSDTATLLHAVKTEPQFDTHRAFNKDIEVVRVMP